MLQGLGTKDKYSGSYEQLAKIIRAFVPSEGQNKALRAFFNMVALFVGLRNGDAHRKNFCVLYDSPVLRQCQLAPTFDQITTTAYLPHDSMALLLRGSKRWPNRAGLQDFATRACALTPHEAEVDLGEVESGIVLAREGLQDRVQAGGAFADIGVRMLKAWSEGLLAITR